MIVTKLDGTAKGGMLFAIQQEMGLPIHYVGLGEKVEDLVLFNPDTLSIACLKKTVSKPAMEALISQLNDMRDTIEHLTERL